MAIFGTKHGGAATGGEGDSGAFKRDPRKARRFFEYAQAVADARNYDYSIDCYVNGLKHDPENLPKYEALRDVSLKRKLAGGKPSGMLEQFKSGGKDPVDKLLHALRLWAKDPLNASLMITVMQRAVEIHNGDNDLNLGDVALWVGNLAIEACKNTKKPSKATFIKICDLFVSIRAYDRAVEACRVAVQLDTSNSELLQRLKDLEAERTISEGGYEKDARASVLDTEKQRELALEDTVNKTQSALEELLAKRRAELEEDPQDLDRMLKLVAVLEQTEADASEDEAITLLREAWERTGQYRLKMRAGDIKMKQLGRQQRALKAAVDAHPEDAEAKKKLHDFMLKRVHLELEEYTERVKNYPTDLGMKFNLGLRLLQLQKVDEAIGVFQQSKADPKLRSLSQEYLGVCYKLKGWYEEAIDTLRQGVEGHALADDKLGMSLRLNLMDALEKSAAKKGSLEHAREAQKIASQILQANINYGNIQHRMESIRALVRKLEDQQNKPAGDAPSI